ncbi:hypothetical protein ACVIIW_001906 [Bradyrhizobium sp. USDA 4449]
MKDDHDLADYDQAFEKRLIENFDEAESLIGHSFVGIKRMIAIRGGVLAAKYFVSVQDIDFINSGLRVLFAAKLLRLSVEQAVIDQGVGHIFSKVQITNAVYRLWLVQNERAL